VQFLKVIYNYICRSDSVSPQAADVINNSGEPKRHTDREIKRNSTPDKETSHSNANRRVDEIKPSENRFSGDGLPEKYQKYFQGNSSDFDSEIDEDELTPDSPRDRNKLDFAQHLPSNINPYGSPFGAEEARLRFSFESSQFKERLNALGIPQLTDERIGRRYSLQESSTDASKHNSGSSSPPSSSPSRSLDDSPQNSYKGSRSIHDLSFDEQDSNAFLPRIKEGLFFCHLCSFSGNFNNT
jgi:hypothetical protein